MLAQLVHNPASFQFAWKIFRHPLETLSDLAREQGDIARLDLGRRTLFLLNHPALIEEVLVGQAENFVKGPSLQRARIILGDGLLTSEGEQHLTQRRALQPAFHRHKMEAYLPLMNENIQAHIAGWQDGDKVNMSAGMMRLTLNIALWSFFGSAPEGSVERVGKAMKTLVQLFPFAQFPWLESVRGLFPNFQKARKDLETVTEALLRQPKAEGALLHILKDNHDGQFSDEQIRAHALTFLLAGHETTALLLAWCWDMLAHHPNVQSALQAEVDSVLSQRLPTLEDMQQLSYTRAVVKETLRMRPPAWAIGREAVRDCDLGGQFIPAGSTVLMSQWVTHHDARFFDAPHQFRPERWLEEPAPPRYSFFPFGGGKRVCIGEHFAMTEAVAVLALVLRRWNVLPVRSDLLKPKPSVTLRPEQDVEVVVAKR